MRTNNSINPHRLYRDPKRGVVAGVCAGIADYFDISLSGVRFLVFILFLASGGLTLLAYFIAAVILKQKPERIFKSHSEEQFWRGLSRSPKESFSELKFKFMKISDRLEKMESYVSSKEFELDQKFKNL